MHRQFALVRREKGLLERTCASGLPRSLPARECLQCRVSSPQGSAVRVPSMLSCANLLKERRDEETEERWRESGANVQ